MTTVYFVRHAQANYENHTDATRELTAQGLEDRKQITKFLNAKAIDAVLSSPYKRAIDTIKHFADSRGMTVEIIDDFRERKISDLWLDDFDSFCQRQWADFSYRLADGESLAQVQERNIRALNEVLSRYQDKNIVIGSHGTALCTVINHFDPSFGYEQFMEMKSLMPWIVKFVFEGRNFQGIEFVQFPIM